MPSEAQISLLSRLSSSGPLASVKVKSGRGMAAFLSSVVQSIVSETGINPKNQVNQIAILGPLQSMIQKAGRVPSGKVATALAPMFGKARQIAIQAGATQTAAAIRSAASWFYYNVEGGAPAGGGEVVQLPGQPPRRRRPGKRGKGGKGTPFYRKWWFVPSVIGGVGLILTVSILASTPKSKRRDDR